MQMKGIDVSSYQGDIDFKQVKRSGVDFVIIKAGEWDHTVDKFEENYEAAKAAGLHIGFYWFCDGETPDEINREADACINALKGKQFDFPIYMDLENDYQYALGRQFCSEAVRSFCGKLEKAGYYAGLYTSTSTLNDLIDNDIKKKYTIWVADWRGYCGYDGEYGMWQYGIGYVPGINGMTDFNIVEFGTETDYPGSAVEDGVDLDYSYEDFPSLIIPNGLNNYPTPEDEWKNDECKKIADVLSIGGTETALSGDKWFLIDKSGEFTLETLPYAKVRIYIIGGGCDGAEWQPDYSEYPREVYGIGLGGRGGSVYVKDITITGNVSCQAFIAQANEPTSTSVKIGNDIYKCNDKGAIWRKASASGNTKYDEKGFFNAESGANGVKTPYGYVGSSGGGGGTYTEHNFQTITVYAGRGGVGAGNGGEVKKDGTDAQNYGCGGGSAGFGGYISDGNTVETHAGHGRGGCIIFEILDSGECDNSPNNPSKNKCNCNCDKLVDVFSCPDPSSSVETCKKETSYSLTFDGEDPVEVETSLNTPCAENNDEKPTNVSSDNIITGDISNSSCTCNKSYSANIVKSKGACGCGNDGSSNGCVRYDVIRWGENWLLFDTTGEYTLNFENDVNLTAYIVGGGCNGKDGLYYNKTAYGGDGGMGGYVNIVSNIEVNVGTRDMRVIIGDVGEYSFTSLIIDNNEYCCNGQGHTVADGGNQGICGRSSYHNAGNGTNGIETPFGWIGSSGGGGAAYYNGNTTNRGGGGLFAGNGGRILDGKSTRGEKAVGYGCGGGGGAASPTSWCKGGKGKRGCVIITW